MNLTVLDGLKFKIARSPRQLEQLRSQVRMNMYLEVKTFAERTCSNRFSKPECARMTVELINRLCGEAAASGTQPLTPEQQHAVDGLLSRIRTEDVPLRVAASFMRWSKAVALLMELRNDEASHDLNAAVALNPKNAFAYCSLSYLAGFQGESKRAVELARKALELDPGLAEAWIEMGNGYEANGEHNLALAAWQKAHSLNPEMVKTRETPDPASLGLPGTERPDHIDVLTDEPES
jgi:tetratricopeptide (TPR) repeat protein